MPCGGIYPVHGEPEWMLQGGCWVCGERGDGPYHFVEEWDAYLHTRCVDEFLRSPEGEVVVSHGHEVIR